MEPDPQRPEQSAQERHKSQEEALTLLLKQLPAPLAPDWFEAKTLARLRREREGEESWWGKFNLSWRWALGGITVAVVLALSIFLLEPMLKSSDEVAGSASKTELSDSAEGDRLLAALDAFASYSDEIKDWDQEPF